MADSNYSIKLIGDDAIDEASEDKLNFNNYALALAKSMQDSKGPLTYGIFGSWGKGKTSLMNLIRSNIKKEEEKRKSDSKESYSRRYFTVWFNPWRYESEDHPVVMLCATIISSLEPFVGEMGQPFEKLRNALKKLIKSITIKASGIEFKLSELFKKKKEIAYKQLSIPSKALKALDEVSDNLCDQKIIVFVDDLDRCLPEKAIKLLESIKLVFSQPHFIFVFGLDFESISSFFDQRYGESQSLIISGKHYIEKLLQVPFDIPESNQTISDYASFLIQSSISPQFAKKVEPILPAIGQLCRNNPREVKRFLNSLLLDREITIDRDKDPLSFLLAMAFTRLLTRNKDWEGLAKALRRNRDQIIEALRDNYIADGKLNDQELSLKADDENEINSSLYSQILEDASLYELISSEQFHNLLSRDENVFRQEFLRERAVKPSSDKEGEYGKRFRPPKRGEIINRGATYDDIMRDKEFNQRVKRLFRRSYEEIQKRSDRKFFNEIDWNFPNGTVGNALGIVYDPLDEREYYLMQFDHNNEEIYQFIGKEGVQILDD